MRLFVFITILFASQKDIDGYLSNDKNETDLLNRECDQGDAMVFEGNIGQKPTFPWLGILRVHIHANRTLQIALTGVVLVKSNYAIGNANDISKIPLNILRSDSKVMFISGADHPWFCKVLDSMPHPEYDITTVNTIAILELYAEGDMMLSKPICWPHTNFNTNNQLFVIGYTDENKLLEKTVYQLQFVDKTLCSEFYKRSKKEVKDDLTDPLNYQCGFSMHSRRNCTWENGRVVASNVSGYWTLIGLVVAGPGCSAPARFLDITAYMPWLITTMELEVKNDVEVPQDSVRRRSALSYKKKWRRIHA